MKIAMKQSGFTFIELIVVIIIASILVILAAPSFVSITQREQASAAANSFLTGLSYARNEAITLGVPISICPASNTNLNACSSNVADWRKGWIIFSDPTASGNLTNTNNILRVNEAVPTGVTLNVAQNRITFMASGFLNVSSGEFTFIFQPNTCQGNNQQIVSLNFAGRSVLTVGNCP